MMHIFKKLRSHQCNSSQGVALSSQFGFTFEVIILLSDCKTVHLDSIPPFFLPIFFCLIAFWFMEMHPTILEWLIPSQKEIWSQRRWISLNQWSHGQRALDGKEHRKVTSDRTQPRCSKPCSSSFCQCLSKRIQDQASKNIREIILDKGFAPYIAKGTSASLWPRKVHTEGIYGVVIQ